MEKMLANTVTLVTGGSRGIGAATAILFGLHGSTVIVNYNKSPQEAEKVVSEILAHGGKAQVFRADVTNKDDVTKMFSHIKDTYGKLDILVNNAGILKDNLLMMIKDEDWDAIINTNLKGVFLCMQQATKVMMKQRSGIIINMSSIIGVYGNAGQVHYAASKAGVIGMTKSAAKELGRWGIRVNAIAPGIIDTDMTKNLKEEHKTKLVSNTALGRIGTPEDIAKVALFLASDLSAYVSGQIIGVDGCQVV
jgi:3-oxoacyl-[acyl-carrier protein] reductase